MAKIAVIVGSVRKDRQGIKVARWLEQKLKERNHTVFFIDPVELDLPLLDSLTTKSQSLCLGSTNIIASSNHIRQIFFKN